MRAGTGRTVGHGSVAVALVAASLVAGTGPARADGPHAPVLVAAASLHDESPEKEVTVRCPGATLVFSAGGGVGGSAGGTGQVVVTAVVPDVGLTTVTVRAVARTGQRGPWSVVGQAICEASGSALRRAVGTAVGEYTATATCGPGTKVWGTGFRVTGDPDHVAVAEVVPDPGLTKVAVGVTSDGPPTEVTAYAICRAQTGTMRRVAAVSPDGAGWPRSVTVADTADARIYGVGGRAGGGPHAYLDALVLRPSGAGGGVRAALAAPIRAAAATGVRPGPRPADGTGVATTDGTDDETVVYGILAGSFH
ncbi:hypothetical protein [Micromonospora sp. NBC_01796]|uniref:hypothetical protein n=1 Tax=Micromonospora sp. NBC_01796 TaxID=2975987 RepID=UPI002DD9F0B4|nr:hypothetical protein [Micromonospora sp. NBC_01796]WSA84285.1 hypothetical protein OIE47_28580 [Micromonospora sp. NBC_01796]